MGSLSLVSYAWQDIRVTVLSVAILIGAIATGLLAQFLLYALLQRFVRGKPGTLQRLLLEKTKTPARYVFPLLALAAGLPSATS